MSPHQGCSGDGAGDGRLDVTISGHISYESSTIGDAMKTRFQRRLRRIDTTEDHTNGQGSTLGDSPGEQDQGDVEETGSGRFGRSADPAAEPTTRVDASTGRDVDEPRQRLDGPARPTFGDEGRRQGGDHPATGLGTEASHPNDGRTLSSPGDHHDDSGFDGRALPATNDEDVRHLDASSEAPAHRTATSPSAIAVADTDTRVDDAHTQRVQTVRDTRDGDTRTSPIEPEAHPAASGGRALLRTPRLAPLAAVGGWAAAWGIAIVALACLAAAGIATGLGLGIADGGPDAADGVTAGAWMAAALALGFLGGGYVAARMARTAPLAHGVTAWLFALLATAADGLVADRRGSVSVLDTLGLPSWQGGDAYSGTDLILPLILLAAASLIGVLVGAALGAAANRRERSPMRQI